MMLQIPALLTPQQVRELRAVLDRAEFVDGRLTAGKAAALVKRNQELRADPRQLEQLAQLVMTALGRSPEFRRGALPHRVSDPIFARYSDGMAYGDHIDDPIMGSGRRYRSDVSLTLFLSEPDEYDGGELVVRSSFGVNEVKLPAGTAVIYPSSSLHRVAEVTRGVRLVAVAWVQSLVREPARRELLYELDLAREALLSEAPGSDTTRHVDNAYVNLVRMWSEV